MQFCSPNSQKPLQPSQTSGCLQFVSPMCSSELPSHLTVAAPRVMETPAAPMIIAPALQISKKAPWDVSWAL